MGDGLGRGGPPWRQPRGKWMVSLVNSHTNATSKRWHLWEIDLRIALNSTTGWGGGPASEGRTGAKRAAQGTPSSSRRTCTPALRAHAVSGFRVKGSGFRVQGSGSRVQGSGLRFRVQGSVRRRAVGAHAPQRCARRGPHQLRATTRGERNPPPAQRRNLGGCVGREGGGEHGREGGGEGGRLGREGGSASARGAG